MDFKNRLGATPIDQDDIHNLIPPLTTQEELNDFENQNILNAVTWLKGNRRFINALLTVDNLKELHGRMFNETWRWAGKTRTSDKNIGVHWPKIPAELKKLCDDVEYQVNNKQEDIEAIAIRFHHRLVAIHPFPNGNGRHGRLATDTLLQANGKNPFSWGRGRIANSGKVRDAYIAALRAADKGSYGELSEFVRA